MAQRFLDREGALIVLLAVVGVVFLSAAGYFLWNPPQDAATVSPPLPVIPDSTSVVISPAAGGGEDIAVTYAGEDGKTVLELLKRDHQVLLDSELLLFGSIVLAIDSLTAAPDEFWTYLRDSLPGDRSPEVCTTQTGETVRWILKHRK